MQEAIAAPLAGWESFYVIVGSSAAALTGLQFVVITLIADARRRGGPAEIAAFGTPTVVHFCAALFVSALLSAPWPTLHGPRLTLLAGGTAGLCYIGIVLRRARRQRGYKPVFEDWLWHTILPAIAYGALVSAAAFMSHRMTATLFVTAGAVLMLLYIGIHNAWDTVTYLAVDQAGQGDSTTANDRPPA
jgi:hypothetical protein